MASIGHVSQRTSQTKRPIAMGRRRVFTRRSVQDGRLACYGCGALCLKWMSGDTLFWPVTMPEISALRSPSTW